MASYNPKVVSSREFDDDDFDFEYFSRTYKPLSNLPTPPPSNRNSVTSSPVLGEEDVNADSSLLGPAVHLVNLHPPGASIMAPSTPLVQTILSRAALPLETIALAVCILDSLDAKFSRKFRMSLPLATTSLPSKRHTITSAASSLITHIDSVAPELIILTALVIAFKFTDDCQEPTQYFASAWGKGLWTCDQINATERCIMEHLGYRILPLCERGIIEDTVEDMRRAGIMALSEKEARVMSSKLAGDGIGGHARSISVPVRPGAGEAVIGLGLSLTPVDTPTEERHTELGAFNVS
ncbi:hypothetical protein N0V93_004173 [Gnomoniopsis smithogilvyi]|uniref:Cyclin N-terminal domain-containing protein n=1 Tax=Gnomoniopsis smithogilvyi TaxID=1191159 RepID=A0A9W8YQL2_9PEZI|nr:hypothetical protein N0V93_004173 [Gnomoniopsis smithogilvyi]